MRKSIKVIMIRVTFWNFFKEERAKASKLSALEMCGSGAKIQLFMGPASNSNYRGRDEIEIQNYMKSLILLFLVDM
jgi:hypothetical protein